MKKESDKMADKFTFFASYYEAIEELDDKTRLKVYDMICRYALYGEIIESENPIEKSLFTIIKPFIDSSEKRRSGGRKGGLSKKQSKIQEDNQGSLQGSLQNDDKVAFENDASNKNKNMNKNMNMKENKRGGFAPPTLSEVQAYCKERNNNVNAETFVNFYQSKDWYVGKNKMKDWKAAVRTWENKSRQENKQQEPESDSDLDKYRMLANQF